MKLNTQTLLVIGAVGVGGYLYYKNRQKMLAMQQQAQSEAGDDLGGGGGFGGGGGSTSATPVTSTAPVVVVPTTQEIKPIVKPQTKPQYKPNTNILDLGTMKPIKPPVTSKPIVPISPVSKFVNFFDGEEIINNNPNMFFEGNI